MLADVRGVKVVAHTDDFDSPEAERIAVLFGRRPADVACPLAHFACPFGKKHVAVVRVEDRPGPGNVLGFRFLLLSRELYRHLGNPFAISDRFPPDWTATGTLPQLSWPAEPLPERTLEQLDAVLKHGDTGLLLGATQALVDGNRVLLKRSGPDEAFARGLWQLLPDRTRVDLWPASFAFSDELKLHSYSSRLCRSRGSPQPLTEEPVALPSEPYGFTSRSRSNRATARGAPTARAHRRRYDSPRLYILAFMLIVALVFRFVV